MILANQISKRLYMNVVSRSFAAKKLEGELKSNFLSDCQLSGWNEVLF